MFNKVVFFPLKKKKNKVVFLKMNRCSMYSNQHRTKCFIRNKESLFLLLRDATLIWGITSRTSLFASCTSTRPKQTKLSLHPTETTPPCPTSAQSSNTTQHTTVDSSSAENKAQIKK